MQSLIRQLYKELFQQQKYLKREDIRNAKKSNQLLLRLVALLEKEINDCFSISESRPAKPRNPILQKVV